MKNLLVWTKDGDLNGCFIQNVPAFFMFEGRRFEPIDFYLADVDYLRNKGGQLVGFSYALTDNQHEFALAESLVLRSGQIKIQNNTLFLFLRETESFEFDVVQAVGTEIYRDETGCCLFVIPDWGFGELAFNLASDSVPAACDQ